jgi:hypothetical protein
MRQLQLCEERLRRIEAVLSRVGGQASLRDLWRSWSIRGWEVEQAAELGWIRLSWRKPGRQGRPSQVATYCPSVGAVRPPRRRDIEPEISIRHQNFAAVAAIKCVHGGARWLGMPGLSHAYREAFPAARSANGISVSTTRLMRRLDVRAARQWYLAQANGRIPPAERMPGTVSGIRASARRFGVLI